MRYFPPITDLDRSRLRKAREIIDDDTHGQHQQLIDILETALDNDPPTRISGVGVPPVTRLLAQMVEAPGPLDTECWLSTRAGDVHGYTTLSVDGRRVRSHRLSYELFVGPIPDGLELDHLCCVPACLNPDHLEVVTHAENMRRSGERQPECRKAGHPRTPENIYTRANGRTYCAECIRIARGYSDPDPCPPRGIVRPRNGLYVVLP